MSTALRYMRELLLEGLRMTPEEARIMREEADRIMAAKAAAEIAHYNSLSAAGKADYDALTEGMMPRLSRRRIGDDPRGGR